MEGSKWKNTRTLIDLLKLESSITCFICKKLPENPHTLWCKHSFCKDCIVSLGLCPCCGFSIKLNDMTPDTMLNKLICVLKAASEVVSKSRADLKLETEGKEVKRGKEIVSPKCSEKVFMKQLLNDKKHDLLVSKQERPKNTSESMFKFAESNKSQNTRNNAKRKNLQDTLKLESDDLTLSVKKLKSPKNSSPKICTYVSAKTGQSENKVNAKGETPLQIACRQGKLIKVEQLLKNGAEPNVKDFANWTPLCDAVGSGNIDVVRSLLTAGAGVNTPSHLNTTALLEAVLRQDKALVKLLLGYGANMHQRTALDNTALSIADDEIRALMMCSNVPIQPYPRVTIVPRAIFVNKLPEDQTEIVMNLCKKFNLTLTANFTENISHMVVQKTNESNCHGSLEVMLGILQGCCIVGLDWVTASLEKDQLLPTDDFEPSGTTEYPNTNVFQRARMNKEQLLPRLFDGCHIALQHEQTWETSLKQDLAVLVRASGAQFLPRACDAERIPSTEQTVMFHAPPSSPLATTSHIVLYQPGPTEPLLKYNMTHIKTLPLSWFLKCIHTFTISL